MKIEKDELSACELTVMKCVWDAPGRVKSDYVTEVMREKYGCDYKETTVFTVLRNLRKKGFLQSERKGVTYFWPARSEQEYCEESLDKQEKMWEDPMTKYASALVKPETLTEEERNTIMRMIDELD